ncbi:hypothetical protein N9850_05665 [Granulosicoccus sp.]|nr:hypothetical protein [Granulosicoccus sp.]MDB4223238.1 hypothetical protein [Granulosicoccus sp.]
MTISIILFGTLVLLAGILLLVNPEIIFGFLRDSIENRAVHLIAVMVRLIFGILLITQSSVSRFPLGIEILGWVFIVAGCCLALIGRNKFRNLMSWVLIKFKPFGRLTGVIAIGFGGFLVYAFL